MTSVLLSAPATGLLLALAAACIQLCGFARRGTMLWALLSGGCTAALVLCGLACGVPLEELAAALLLLAALGLAPLLRGGGKG